jgi:hypothetical protein
MPEFPMHCRYSFAFHWDRLYYSVLQTRGGAVWQLVGLITRRSQVQILPPQPTNSGIDCMYLRSFCPK